MAYQLVTDTHRRCPPIDDLGSDDSIPNPRYNPSSKVTHLRVFSNLILLHQEKSKIKCDVFFLLLES